MLGPWEPEIPPCTHLRPLFTRPLLYLAILNPYVHIRLVNN